MRRENIDAVFAGALDDLEPLTDIRASSDYRRQITPVLVRRTILKARAVPLPPQAVELLRSLLSAHDGPWVIPGRKPGTRLANIDEAWRMIRELAGLEDVRVHDLRHSWASRALPLGEALPMLGKLLGHSRMETTARYAHLARDSAQEAAGRIAASIAEDVL